MRLSFLRDFVVKLIIYDSHSGATKKTKRYLMHELPYKTAFLLLVFSQNK